MCPSVDSIVTKPNTGTEQRSVSHNASVLLFHSAFIFRCSIPGETIGESWGVSFSFSALAFFVAFGLVLCFRFFPAETVWPACCCLPFIPTLGRIPWIDSECLKYLRNIFRRNPNVTSPSTLVDPGMFSVVINRVRVRICLRDLICSLNATIVKRCGSL